MKQENSEVIKCDIQEYVDNLYSKLERHELKNIGKEWSTHRYNNNCYFSPTPSYWHYFNSFENIKEYRFILFNGELDLEEYTKLSGLYLYNLIPLDCKSNSVTRVNNLPITLVNIQINTNITESLDIFSELVNLERLDIGYDKKLAYKFKPNNFYGSLKSLQNCNKLKFLCISNQKGIKGGLCFLNNITPFTSFGAEGTEFSYLDKDGLNRIQPFFKYLRILDTNGDFDYKAFYESTLFEEAYHPLQAYHALQTYHQNQNDVIIGRLAKQQDLFNKLQNLENLNYSLEENNRELVNELHKLHTSLQNSVNKSIAESNKLIVSQEHLNLKELRENYNALVKNNQELLIFFNFGTEQLQIKNEKIKGLETKIKDLESEHLSKLDKEREVHHSQITLLQNQLELKIRSERTGYLLNIGTITIRKLVSYLPSSLVSDELKKDVNSVTDISSLTVSALGLWARPKYLVNEILAGIIGISLFFLVKFFFRKIGLVRQTTLEEEKYRHSNTREDLKKERLKSKEKDGKIRDKDFKIKDLEEKLEGYEKQGKDNY